MVDTQNTNTLTSRWEASMMNNYGTPAVEIVSGHGAILVDSQGRECIDMLSGIAVNSLGQAHPALIEAVDTQMRTLMHVSNLAITEPGVAVAEALRHRFASGIEGFNAEAQAQVEASTRVMFCNSGAEANEAAFKLARLTGRPSVFAAEGGFHGRTMGALAMTGQPDKRAAFEPMPQDVRYYPYGDFAAVEKLVMANPDQVAAIILEPIQGEIGVTVPPAGYLAQIRELTEKIGALMIVDEVQTGVGRTGKFYGFQHEPGVIPDIVTMAKGLAGGIPVGAVVATGPAATLFTPGSHGTTFGGNPISMAAARAVLDIIDTGFLEEVTAKGEHLQAKLNELDTVASTRGQGLMVGAVLTGEWAKQAVAKGPDYGLILNAPQKDVIRLVPPLIITEAEIDEAVSRLGRLLADVSHANQATQAN